MVWAIFCFANNVFILPSISPQHLSRQRDIKCRQFPEPEMTKQEVEQKCLGEYFVMPEK